MTMKHRPEARVESLGWLTAHGCVEPVFVRSLCVDTGREGIQLRAFSCGEVRHLEHEVADAGDRQQPLGPNPNPDTKP